MLHALVRGVGVVRQSRPHAVQLVDRDTGANTAPADQYAPFRAAVLDRRAELDRDIGIVDWLSAVRADVDNLVAIVAQRSRQGILHLESPVVGADDNAHEDSLAGGA